MTPRKITGEELTQEKIINVAREHFVQKGYNQVSMRQIAKELNCSHGAIYYHFKNKAELFYAIVQADYAFLDQLLIQTLTKSYRSDEEALKEILLTFIHFGLTYKSHFEFMFLTKNSEMEPYFETGPNESYQRFAEAVAKLVPNTLSPSKIWCLFLALIGFVTKYVYSDTSYEEVKNLAKEYTSFLIRGLKT
ncbi:TetR/AcrR family transcriptional regulator [Aeribacillus alveayuensis]|uniref:AcrR family transcriptional regulator n=1 Tax=Aeribacillus alveayuensis TaxID=279215 RepID=A0ABT9VNV6_9BACI|nr:AcrR family transcriptional regulator [Bacillus alveayuensis]